MEHYTMADTMAKHMRFISGISFLDDIPVSSVRFAIIALYVLVLSDRYGSLEIQIRISKFSSSWRRKKYMTQPLILTVCCVRKDEYNSVK